MNFDGKCALACFFLGFFSSFVSSEDQAARLRQKTAELIEPTSTREINLSQCCFFVRFIATIRYLRRIGCSNSFWTVGFRTLNVFFTCRSAFAYILIGMMRRALPFYGTGVYTSMFGVFPGVSNRNWEVSICLASIQICESFKPDACIGSQKSTSPSSGAKKVL